MSTFDIVLFLIVLLVLGWAVWFVIEWLRYVLSGEYEIDKRLHDICK